MVVLRTLVSELHSRDFLNVAQVKEYLQTD